MDWLESVELIRQAQENNQLVIFVGAGVSKNSGVPSWAELINSIADKIGYQHYNYCANCSKRNSECPKADCEFTHIFTQDEFLRIPEYFYQIDKSDNYKNYYDFIINELHADQRSNPIDDEIYTLLPHHIITTNFDSLLEDSANSYVDLYSVVHKDRDLLLKASDHYLVKMHGDLAIPDSIVLKESDYIDYEQEHPLISAFIRSLLINHSFLFLGYSLNDYNLNLIIGWINYFQKKYKVTERPKSFLIVNKAPSIYEIKRQESKNIFSIDISKIPPNTIKKANVPDSLQNEIGQRLYTYLRSIDEPQIIDDIIPLEGQLKKKYTALNSYNKISYYDFIHTFSFGNAYFASTELVLNNDIWYEKTSDIIRSGNNEIVSYFSKAGITAVHREKDDEKCAIPSDSAESDSFFNLYINNDYSTLKESLEKDYDCARKLYYARFLNSGITVINSLVEQMYLDLADPDYVSILLCKMRERLAKLSLFDYQEAKTNEIKQLFNTVPAKYKNSIGYLKMLFNSPDELSVSMQELLEKQEERNRYGSTKWINSHAFTQLWRIQAYAYDYYFFFKANYLPMDYYSDVKHFFKYYVQAMLCSYTPVAPSDDTAILPKTDHIEYPINDIDLDILVKYTDTSLLSSCLKKYSVQAINLTDCQNIVVKYTNLCDSYIEMCLNDWAKHIMNFTIVIFTSNLDILIKEKAFHAFFDRFEKACHKSERLGEALFASLVYQIKNASFNISYETKNQILSVLLEDNLYKSLIQRHRRDLQLIFKKLGSSIKNTIQDEIKKHIDEQETTEEKIQEIIERRSLLPMQEYKELLSENIDLIDLDSLFELILEKELPFTQSELSN